jgi:bis(5'-nucleosyl)-tetraphosphatase (symmetrical)
MSTYAIGDIQGCFAELTSLLQQVNYDQRTDHLWFVGDLINRGPDNVQALDLIMSLPNVTCVLGNHDLHFLAVACGAQTLNRKDTLSDLLASDRLPEYIEFLRNLPLIHFETRGPDEQFLLVHAGLPPQLSVEQCLDLAGEVEAVLQSENPKPFLAAMYGNEPAVWQDNLTGMDRLRVITNYFTRLRFCNAAGEVELTHKEDIAPEGYDPWYSFGRSDQLKVLFGHWAALEGNIDSDFAVPLDTGCVWGREMTAMRLEDGMMFSVPSIHQSSIH